MKKGTNIYIDPVTRQRIPFMKHAGDFTYDRSGDDAIAREDVPLIGDWSDWTGSGTADSKTQQWFAATANELQGTDPQITDGVKKTNLSVIGTRADTHRRRVIKVYIDPNNPNAR